MRRVRPSAIVAVVLLAGIVLYAGLLRLDGLFKSYGPYDHPAWLASLQRPVTRAAAALTPDWAWRRVKVPYVGGDPVNYLKFAREMKHFYAAHVREPGFPGATRVALALTGGADVAVSLASIAFALGTLVAAFALGCALGSPAAGLAAALALGIDRTAAYWSIGGWRDEMFAFFAVLSAWAWLRLARQPSDRRAVVAGIVSAGALLTRITSLSFLVPASLFLLVRGASKTEPGTALAARPVRHVGIAIVIVAILTGPFFINCAIATGDPFYAINNHTAFYLNREGTPEPVPTSAVRYTIDKFTHRPLAAADTVATGLFLYPFENKWVGLDEWSPGLGQVLAVLAVAGLVAWVWQPDGRLLLLVLFSALVPFSVTWTVIGGAEWRLTFFAYAFQLLAAFWVVDALARRAPGWRQLSIRQAIRPAAVVALMASVFAAWTYAMPYAVVRETLQKDLPATIPAGHRDWWFFGSDWSRLVVTGNVVSRFATAPVATARLLLPVVRPYTLVMRMHPLDIPHAAPQHVDVSLNGVLVASLELAWNPDRIGEYRIDIPAGRVRPGLNELAFRSRSMAPVGAGREAFPNLRPDEPVGFRLWYVTILPR